MGRINKNLWVLFFIGMGLFFQGAARAENSWPEFSADVTQTVDGQVMQSKVYATTDKTRMETMGQTIIIRRDLNVNWILMPPNMVMEQPLDSTSYMGTSSELDGTVDRVSEGHEMLDGRDVEKFRITTQTPKGNMVFYQWMSGGNLPVKMESADGKWGMHYKNVQAGNQPAELFEIPAGYQKMNMGGDMSQMIAALQNQNLEEEIGS